MSVVGQSSVDDESSNEQDESRDEQTVANTEAVECFKKCLTWMETKRCGSYSTYAALKIDGIRDTYTL